MDEKSGWRLPAQGDASWREALETLRAESRLTEGRTPTDLPNAIVRTPTYQISSNAFLLALPNGSRFYYRKGAGCVFSPGSGTGAEDSRLFFDGTVYGAIAWLNGMVPIHASSVVHEGRVYAFAGVSGEGKSTLVSALARAGVSAPARGGFEPFSDDLLVLYPARPGGVAAFRGRTQLKLWSDALERTGRSATRAVRPGIDKYYADDIAFAAQALRSGYRGRQTIGSADSTKTGQLERPCGKLGRAGRNSRYRGAVRRHAG